MYKKCIVKNVKNEKPMRIQDKNIGKYREKSEN